MLSLEFIGQLRVGDVSRFQLFIVLFQLKYQTAKVRKF